MELNYEEFVAARGPALQRLARGLLRNPSDAEDVVQDVLAKALLKWNRISAADDPIAYVNHMLVNESTSFWRRTARREDPRAPEDLPVSAAADATQRFLDRDALLAAVRTLPTKQRSVVALRYLDEMDDERIADILDMTTGAVRVNASRGLATLRAAMKLPATV
ncbi:SigE family RNA polymerase sigma factor [Kineococcus radiotolerans]|uniref:RNA polymerase, sigma-24 subunit, ECF subfamily n=1 Tax=Kineococcus radiotolerans (strain ATCC BAA-149 / DSM 14245 / SRS30216) TaxID=266940 RepID=A6WAF2_KINRD|nr:SigE family RNA polymerase sigma factor [Kineococcus radiotolerans]ABS03791.1 RNA polymerase, sigma-24 subunit, ECF subfamily [Kineococcus radiotolerans SRS30216 = ATCC BAA-149]